MIGEPTMMSLGLEHFQVSSESEEFGRSKPHGRIALTDEFALDNSGESSCPGVGLELGIEAEGLFRVPPITPPITAARTKMPNIVPYMIKKFLLLKPQMR